jgi:mevalonate kinase
VDVAHAPDDDPLATAVRAALGRAGCGATPEWLIEVTSTVPVARGLGSSAAVAVALARAVGLAAGADFDDRTVSELAFEAERRTHGAPSGIDNSVVAHGRAIRFEKGAVTPLDIRAPLTLIVGDTGQRATTREIVAGVRDRHDARPNAHGRWFDRIGQLVDEAGHLLASGELIRLGWVMDSNHLVLQALRVSTDGLDRLVAAARGAGALGAKLSGAGGGGVIVALVESGSADRVEGALQGVGAADVIRTTVEATK